MDDTIEGDKIGQDKTSTGDIISSFVIIGDGNRITLPEGAETAFLAGQQVLPPIFISYASEDRAEVEKLVAHLRSEFTVWFDRDDLDAGENWMKQINQGILRCVAMIAVISDKARAKIADTERGRVIRHEQTEAMRLFRPVIPVLLDGDDLPGYYPEKTQYIKTETPGSISPILPKISTELGKRLRKPGRLLANMPPGTERSFVGREAELKAIFEMMGGDDSVVITSQQSAAVQGQGGVGKTMIAQELLRRLRPRYPGGVLQAEFGPPDHDEAGKAIPRDLASPILNTWARLALADRFDPNQQYGPEEVRALLAGYGEVLVLIDDVWDSDLESLRRVLKALPPEADRLVTTRFPVVATAAGSRLFTLGRLELPDGLALLRERLKNLPGPAPAEAMLTRAWRAVDGHALSLDLLAGRVTHLADLEDRVAETEQAIQSGEGLEDLALLLPEEAKSSNDALLISLRLSYEHLSAGLKTAYRALGVFAPRGSFDRGALAAVWGAPNQKAAHVAADRLIAAGLLSLEGGETPRYLQHMTLRAYGRALLSAKERAAATRRHAEYYARLAYDHYNLNTARRLFEEFEQLEAAFGFALGDEDPDLLFRLAWETHNTLRLAGRWDQGKAWMKAALDAQKREDSETLRRKSLLLDGLIDLAFSRGYWGEAESMLRKVAEIDGATGDRHSISVNKAKLADLAAKRGDWAEAEPLYREALEAFEALGDRRTIAVVKVKLADLAAKRGDWAEAERLWREHGEVMAALGDRREVAVGKGKLANLAAKRGQWDEAERLWREIIETFRKLGDRVEEAINSYNLAGHLRERGRLDEAIALMERVVAIDREINHPDLESDSARLEQFRAERDAAEGG